ncbi:MAG: type II toxin-antitoxin system HicB family antitoxin [Clostridium sp.]|nr:type II toxin-antitoxin system HicB family antitoxin [Clostridium sp.]
MAKYVYPAVFTLEKNGLYAIDFPDIDGCHTSGDSILEGMEMAEDALAMMLCCHEKDGEPIPKASAINDIKTDSDSFVTLILADTTNYPLVECSNNGE